MFQEVLTFYKNMKNFLVSLVCALGLAACTTPHEYIQSGVEDKINYAYSKKDLQSIKNCIKNYWATREVRGLLASHYMSPLIEVPMKQFERLQWESSIIFDVYQINDETVIRQSHQIDIHPIWKNIIKEVMLSCSERQKFSNLAD